MYRNILSTFIDKSCIVMGKNDVKTILCFSVKPPKIAIFDFQKKSPISKLH